MAIWDGVPYERVLQDVIIREVKKGHNTLEIISEKTILNGQHPTVEDLQTQADYLVKRRDIVFQDDMYMINNKVNESFFTKLKAYFYRFK